MFEVLIPRIVRLEKVLLNIEKNIQEQLKLNYEKESLEVLLQILVHLQQKKAVPKPSMGKEFQERWLDKQEVMQLLKIGDRTLFSLRKNKQLPYKTIGGKMYFNIKDLEVLMKKNGESTMTNP